VLGACSEDSNLEEDDGLTVEALWEHLGLKEVPEHKAMRGSDTLADMISST
jgi:hypothetical protein